MEDPRHHGDPQFADAIPCPVCDGEGGWLEPWTLPAARRVVLVRDGGCLRCGQAAGLHVHHRKGRSGTDPHDPANLVALCGPCHAHVHSHPEQSYADGWMVRRLGTDKPADIPVLDQLGYRWLVGQSLTPDPAASAPGGAS